MEETVRAAICPTLPLLPHLCYLSPWLQLFPTPALALLQPPYGHAGAQAQQPEPEGKQKGVGAISFLWLVWPITLPINAVCMCTEAACTQPAAQSSSLESSIQLVKSVVGKGRGAN